MVWVTEKPRKYKVTAEILNPDNLVCEVKVSAVTLPTFWERLTGFTSETTGVTKRAFVASADQSAISMTKQKLTLEVETEMQNLGHHK